MKENILEDYKKNEKKFDAFRNRVEHLLTDLLSEQEIEIHQISSRIKTIQSLSKKIDDKNEKYQIIDEITDIIGIRIITYLESDVDSISDLIDKEFIKDEENSIDKRKLKADQFGYRSLHIVASFNSDRCELREYKRYKGIKCEIQVRSILQHAWAEIEHDLGYKGENTIPEQYKRTFNRLSALLETADIEFDRLKTDLATYEKGVPDLIKSEPQLVDINKASITSFLKTNPILLKAKKIVEDITGLPVEQVELPETAIARAIYVGFRNIAAIEKSLNEEEATYLSFIKTVVETYTKGRAGLSSTPTILFFDYLILKTEDILQLDAYYKNISHNYDDAEYRRRIQLYKQSVN